MGRRTGVCAATGETLEAGEPIVTVLIDSPHAAENALERRDYRQSAWSPGLGLKEGERVFAFWKGCHPAGDHRGPVQILSDEDMLDLFMRTGLEPDDPRQVTFRYVLGLLLIRRRMLTLAGHERRSDVEVMLVKVRGRPEEVLEIVDPGLDDEALETETQAVVAMLAPEDSDTPESAPETATGASQ